ncbi:MAG TPA: YjbQ family protein, partial [Candidatus Aerophobetes bacterium]|nr:YjbQ family protein [Candidatus Aerophobetes bacterium]
STTSRVEFLDITSKIEDIVEESGIRDGICYIFVPHTTAAVTINEGADPSVRRDIIAQLDKIVPPRGDYTHMEGNSPAHIKASLIGSSQIVFVQEGRISLGTWQSIYFCEFDGPRTRRLIVKITEK